LLRLLGLERLSDSFLIVYAGSFEPRLDFATVFEAVERAYGDGQRIMLILVGKGLSGSFEKQLRRECAGKPFVYFAGYQSDLMAVSYYMNVADACIAPYRIMLTNFGVTLKVMEYLATRKPILITPIPDVTKRWGACVTVYRSTEDLYRAITDMMRQAGSLDKLDSLGQCTPEEFTWKRIASRYEGILLQRAGEDKGTVRQQVSRP